MFYEQKNRSRVHLNGRPHPHRIYRYQHHNRRNHSWSSPSITFAHLMPSNLLLYPIAPFVIGAFSYWQSRIVYLLRRPVWTGVATIPCTISSSPTRRHLPVIHDGCRSPAKSTPIQAYFPLKASPRRGHSGTCALGRARTITPHSALFRLP